ncbi:MAG: oligosaccharide flippase family protein [Bacteroidales bacterium]|nr:oligosaccharide flippase family protein [Bacteroidales bacterium]
MFFGYVLLWIISRYFGAKAQGIYSLLISIIAVLVVVGKVGTGMALVRFGSKFLAQNNHGELKDFYFTILKLVIPLSFLLSISFLIFPGFIAETIFNKPDIRPYLPLVFYAVLPMSLLQINQQMTRVFKKIGRYGFLNFFITFYTIAILFFIISLKADLNIGIPITIQTISIFIMFVVSLLFVYKLMDWKKVKSTGEWTSRKILKYSFPMMTIAVMSIIMQWLDKILLGFYVQEADLGIYHVMQRLALLVGLSLLSLNSVVVPRISKLYSLNDWKGMKMLIHRSTKAITISSVFIFLLLIFFSEYIIGFFGEEYRKGYNILIILSVAQLFNSWAGPAGQFLLMTGNEKFNQKVVFIMVLLFLTLSLSLIPVVGILGAAISIASIIFIRNIIYIIYIRRKYGIMFLYLPLQIRKRLERDEN